MDFEVSLLGRGSELTFDESCCISILHWVRKHMTALASEARHTGPHAVTQCKRGTGELDCI